MKHLAENLQGNSDFSFAPHALNHVQWLLQMATLRSDSATLVLWPILAQFGACFDL